LAYPVLVDALFLVFYGFVTAGFGQKLFEYLTEMGLEVARGAGAATVAPRLSAIIVLYSLALYLLVAVFQGSAWWLCHGFVQKHRRSYHDHMVGFAKLSLIWGVFVMGYAFVSYGISLSAMVKDREPGEVISSILLVSALMILYMASLSYSIRGKGVFSLLGRTITKAVELRILLAFAAICAVFILLGLLLSQVSSSLVLSALVQLLMVLPALSVSRILLINASRD
jgi:hypothetical protein